MKTMELSVCVILYACALSLCWTKDCAMVVVWEIFSGNHPKRSDPLKVFVFPSLYAHLCWNSPKLIRFFLLLLFVLGKLMCFLYILPRTLCLRPESFMTFSSSSLLSLSCLILSLVSSSTRLPTWGVRNRGRRRFSKRPVSSVVGTAKWRQILQWINWHMLQEPLLIVIDVLQGWKGTNLTTRLYRLRSTSNLNTICGTTFISWFW